jgi:hypothetical protein
MFSSNNPGFTIYLMAIWETRKLRDLHTCTIDHVLCENLVKEGMEISKPTTKKKSAFMDKTIKFNKQVNIMKWKVEK